MLVRLLEPFTWHRAEHLVGEIIDLPRYDAEALVQAGVCEPVKTREPLERAVVVEDFDTPEGYASGSHGK